MRNELLARKKHNGIDKTEENIGESNTKICEKCA